MAAQASIAEAKACTARPFSRLGSSPEHCDDTRKAFECSVAGRFGPQRSQHPAPVCFVTRLFCPSCSSSLIS